VRILVAPDKFAGTLTAAEAAAAIVEGWHRHAPDDELQVVPMADGGPGFVHTLHASLGGELLAVTVSGPYGDPTPGSVLLDGGAGGTAYVESAQACGLHLTPEDERRPEHATTTGVGELIAAAIDAGAARVVIGLGGSATNDGGAGMLSSLGATADVDLRAGVVGLSGVSQVDLAPARERVSGVTLVAASDVDNPLLGLRGAINVFGPQKGVADDRRPPLDALLEQFAEATDRQVADLPGAGAAGGLGFALLLLGATREPGIDLIADAVGLAEHARAADLVISGEGAFDYSSRGGKVVYGVAQVAGAATRPCVVLAGRVDVGAREMRTLGVESAYSVSELVGVEQAMGEPAESLATLAARVARTWSR